MAVQGCADVDGQSVVDQIGCGQPPEIVWAEMVSGKPRIGLGQVLAD
ncbi:hypothetical protein [Nocardia coubleae]|uniref:Uncharacterized protein n=1 Tax=Nocardia coubleae TaxID=356147 RepID=A0A846VZL8_9NOCA|nr:hypothetical protein [Nocardia coubleae]NKX86073.1 hypothetical protein [Nocardia coubleae]